MRLQLHPPTPLGVGVVIVCFGGGKGHSGDWWLSLSGWAGEALPAQAPSWARWRPLCGACLGTLPYRGPALCPSGGCAPSPPALLSPLHMDSRGLLHSPLCFSRQGKTLNVSRPFLTRMRPTSSNPKRPWAPPDAQECKQPPPLLPWASVAFSSMQQQPRIGGSPSTRTPTTFPGVQPALQFRRGVGGFIPWQQFSPRKSPTNSLCPLLFHSIILKRPWTSLGTFSL